MSEVVEGLCKVVNVALFETLKCNRHLTDIQAFLSAPISMLNVELCWDSMSRLSVYDVPPSWFRKLVSSSPLFFLLKQRFNQRSGCRTYNLGICESPFAQASVQTLKGMTLDVVYAGSGLESLSSRFCYP